MVGVGLEVVEAVARQVGHQLLKRGGHKLEAVDEAQPAERKRDVLCHVVRDHVNASGMATECWGDEVSVTTGTSTLDPPFDLFPLKWRRRLHLLCAAPRYAPVRWLWSRTIRVPSFPQMWQVVAAAKLSMLAGVMTIGTGQSIAVLMSRYSCRSDSRKWSTTSGPRYTTGVDV